LRGQWKQYEREIAAIFNWCKQVVDYRRDPHDVELVQDPMATLERGRADCDDFCILLCAACEVLGAPCRFVTVSTRPDGEPSHVFVECFVGGRWVPMDASVQGSTFGWAPGMGMGVKNRKVWTRKDVGLSGYSDEFPMVEGLGMHDSMPGGWTDDYYNSGPSKAYEGGFAQGMRVVHVPGVPNDISNTFAPGLPGPAVSPARRIPSDLVAEYADQEATLRADDPGIPYPYEGPIQSFKTPGELFHVQKGSVLPDGFSPATWERGIPVYRKDPDYIYPDGGPAMNGLGTYMTYRRATRLHGLGVSQSTIEAGASLAQSILTMLDGGELPKSTTAIEQAIAFGAGVLSDKEQAEAKKEAAKIIAARTGVPVTGSQSAPSSGLPGWVIPVGIGVAVLGVGLALSR